MLMGCVPTNIKKETTNYTTITVTTTTADAVVPKVSCASRTKVIFPPKPVLPNITRDMSDEEINARLALHIEALNKYIGTLRDAVGQ